MLNNFFFDNSPVYEIRKNVVQPSRPKGQHAGYLRLQTHTHTTLIAFELQQWLRSRASLLRYTYIACLVYAQLNQLFEENKSMNVEKVNDEGLIPI